MAFPRVRALAIVGGTLVLPLTPLGYLFGFTPLLASFLLVMAAIVALYIIFAEAVKRIFYRRIGF